MYIGIVNDPMVNSVVVSKISGFFVYPYLWKIIIQFHCTRRPAADRYKWADGAPHNPSPQLPGYFRPFTWAKKTLLTTTVVGAHLVNTHISKRGGDYQPDLAPSNNVKSWKISPQKVTTPWLPARHFWNGSIVIGRIKSQSLTGRSGFSGFGGLWKAQKRDAGPIAPGK